MSEPIRAQVLREPTPEQVTIGAAILETAIPMIRREDARFIAIGVWEAMFDARPPRPAVIAYPGLTKAQARHYEILLEFVEEHKRAPSQRELAKLAPYTQQNISLLQRRLREQGYIRTKKTYSGTPSITWIKPREA